MSEQDQTEDATSDATNDQTENTDTNSTDSTAGDNAGEDKLGDAGKQALDRMKQRVKDAEKLARESAAELKRRTDADALRDKPAEEQALEAARAEARAEANQKANERILRADLRAAATGKLADPTDAALYLDLTEFAVSDNGDTDSDALATAIAELLERKPHLAAGKPNRFDGGADQGAKGKVSKPAQLTDADLETMSAAEIEQARQDGRLKKLMQAN